MGTEITGLAGRSAEEDEIADLPGSNNHVRKRVAMEIPGKHP
jgi:hypothetical protein